MALSAHMESTKEKTHGEHQRENTRRALTRKHKESTQEKGILKILSKFKIAKISLGLSNYTGTIHSEII